MSGTMRGMRVIDLSRYIAGPTATMMLADQGADVIKVEPLHTGDPSRQSGPFVQQESVYFMSANRNKRSVAVDLRSPAGLAVVRKLAEGADVLVENFKPGTLADMGLSWEHLKDTNPRLVVCSISGFGEGPVGSQMAGFDQNVQAMGAFMSINGEPDGEPMRAGIPIADSSTGLIAAFAIAAKLLERERTGHGGPVSTSLMQSMTFMLTYQAQKYLSLGLVAGREGNDHPLLFPQGTFRTSDGYITIASGNERMWRQLCAVLDWDQGIAEDHRFVDNASRLANRRELRGLIEEKLATAPSAEWIARIGGAGVPCGPVLDIQEAFEHPVAFELELAPTVEHPTLGAMKVLGRPAVTGNDRWLRLPPPRHGEHTAEVLDELGFDSRDLSVLASAGAIAPNWVFAQKP